jgi:copper chaperone CopZ
MNLTIDGMHCSACVRRVRSALEKLPGAQVEELEIGRARVTGAEQAEVLAALEQAGFPARVSSS